MDKYYIGLYAKHVINGYKTMDQVPERYKEDVLKKIAEEEANNVL